MPLAEATEGGWERLRRFFSEQSLLSLILANLATIVLAVIEKWDLQQILWIYWAQSVIIGAFQFLRILKLHDFTTEGLKINDEPVDPTPATRAKVASFFALHYGFFHLIYAAFLAVKGIPPRSALLPMAGMVALFFANHLFSYRHNREQDMARSRNLGTMMFFPYARILPMHLTILFGWQLARGNLALILFLLLKTGADATMHAVEHRQERDPLLPLRRRIPGAG